MVVEGITYNPVKSVKQLQKICSDGADHDFALMLTGCKSCKTISYDKDEMKPWRVFHSIDETEEFLTTKELKTETNIVKGIERGNFFEEVI